MSIEKHTFATVIEASTTGDEPSITISTCAVDREHDEIVAKGGDFTAYLKNPVVLFGHDHRALPVGATTRLDVESGRGITLSRKVFAFVGRQAAAPDDHPDRLLDARQVRGEVARTIRLG